MGSGTTTTVFGALFGATAAYMLYSSGGVGALSALIGGAVLWLATELVSLRIVRARELQALRASLARVALQTDSLVLEIEGLKARLQDMAATYDAKAAQRNARLVKEMKLIEDLVQQLAEGVEGNRQGPVSMTPRTASAATASALTDKPAPAPDRAKPASALDELSETELLEVIRSALEDNRIDLYLQPMVDLPQRRVRAYEGLSRLRSLDGEVIEPAQYLRVATPAGLMPIIDNLLLFRCVQIVRRLLKRHNKRAIFCNISLHSLTDVDFFPQFLEFMSENKSLAPNLIFEFSEETLKSCGPAGEANLEALSALGFTFSLDNVQDLKFDFGWARRRAFRYVKVAAETLLRPMPGDERRIANFTDLIARQGLELIADRIEDEAVVLQLLEHDMKLAQGYLFGEPRPIRRELLEDAAEDRAA